MNHRRRNSTRFMPPFVLLVTSSFVAAYAEFCLPLPGASGACWPNGDNFRSFYASLSNATTVYTPEQDWDVYLSEATSMNLLKSTAPALIVVPGNEADLIKSVVFANKNRIRIVTRCSGHDYNGRSAGRGVMLIKMERLRNSSFDTQTQTITFSSGCTHADVYSALEPYGRLYVGGQSKTVCPAGCLAGGCHGLLSRQYGLGIDNILEIRFLLFNGTVLTLSRTRHSQLFHAYLGAGQNSFGIALSFKARTYPAPPLLYETRAVFAIHDTSNASRNVLSTYLLNATWWKSQPAGLAGNIFIFSNIVATQWFYTGAKPDEALAVLLPLYTSPFVLNVEPTKNYTSMAKLAEGIYPAAQNIWTRSFISNSLVPPNQAVLDRLTNLVLLTKPTIYMWSVFGGAAAKGTTGAVPPGMRTAMYEVLIGSQWADPTEDIANLEAIQAGIPYLYEQSAYSYNNEVTTWGGRYNVVQDWKKRFFSGYDKLLEVKKMYDPCNLFTAMYGIGSDLPVATCSLPK